MTIHASLRRLPILSSMAVAVALFALACGGSSPEVTATAEATQPPQPSDAGTSDSAASDSPAYDFPTGEPVLVAAGYTHPGDRVDNTGSYLPANGKPTVVFVDAIW